MVSRLAVSAHDKTLYSMPTNLFAFVLTCSV